MKKTIKEINWMQNVESIFTEDELRKLVDEKKLEKVRANKEVFYIKKGTKDWFFKEGFIIKKSRIEEFYDEFDEDLDRLYQEEVDFMMPNYKGKQKKPKKRLKYPESFYEHWKNRIIQLAQEERGEGYEDALKDISKIIKPIIILLERIDRGDYFNEDDKELKWRDSLKEIRSLIKDGS